MGATDLAHMGAGGFGGRVGVEHRAVRGEAGPSAALAFSGQAGRATKPAAPSAVTTVRRDKGRDSVMAEAWGAARTLSRIIHK
ncbi:hypothetical protein SVIOM74S_05374 [Streptomyces violarus]